MKEVLQNSKDDPSRSIRNSRHSKKGSLVMEGESGQV